MILPSDFWGKIIIKMQTSFQSLPSATCVHWENLYKPSPVDWTSSTQITECPLAKILSLSKESPPPLEHIGLRRGRSVNLTIGICVNSQGPGFVRNLVIKFLQRPWLINQIFIHLCKYKLKQRIPSEPGLPTQVLFHVNTDKILRTCGHVLHFWCTMYSSVLGFLKTEHRRSNSLQVLDGHN